LSTKAAAFETPQLAGFQRPVTKNMQATELITRERLQSDIRNLGIGKGDHLVIFVSYRAVGNVVGGPKGLIETLLDVVGYEGTILCPTFTLMYPLSLVRHRNVPVFIKERTPSVDGIFSEFVRTDSRALRSSHPTNSYAAIGLKAEYLLKDHDQNSPSYSLYSKMAEIKGKSMMIGVNYRMVGGFHEAQYKAGLLSLIPPQSGALYLDNKNSEQVYIRRDKGGCVRRVPDIVQNLKYSGIVTEGFIGRAKTFVVPSKESLEIMTDLLTRTPENYLCTSASCLWCREIEKYLGLKDKVKDRKWFHKYPILRFLLDRYNYIRLKDISAITLSRYYGTALVKKILQERKSQ
jgi:aminoglycoside 3-N-acetyltransferase